MQRADEMHAPFDREEELPRTNGVLPVVNSPVSQPVLEFPIDVSEIVAQATQDRRFVLAVVRIEYLAVQVRGAKVGAKAAIQSLPLFSAQPLDGRILGRSTLRQVEGGGIQARQESMRVL
jgi:hypothetical protein